MNEKFDEEKKSLNESLKAKQYEAQGMKADLDETKSESLWTINENKEIKKQLMQKLKDEAVLIDENWELKDSIKDL